MNLIKVKEFLEQYPDVTVLGFAWACYWRLFATIFAIQFALVFVVMFLGALIA
jgi:hypothetical protein